jgi:hypothetical protein
MADQADLARDLLALAEDDLAAVSQNFSGTVDRAAALDLAASAVSWARANA